MDYSTDPCYSEFSQGQVDRAVKFYGDAVKADPADPRGLSLLSERHQGTFAERVVLLADGRR
jgi:pyridoxine/pyridoxamine 5'-phosphate oxidase